MKSLLKVDSRGALVVAIATAFCVLINYLIPGRAFELLMALVINWAMISLAHLKFRAAKNRESVEPKFKAIWYPFSNYLCLLFMAGILVIMYLTPGIHISVLLIPLLIAVLAVGYAIKQRSQCISSL